MRQGVIMEPRYLNSVQKLTKPPSLWMKKEEVSASQSVERHYTSLVYISEFQSWLSIVTSNNSNKKLFYYMCNISCSVNPADIGI